MRNVACVSLRSLLLVAVFSVLFVCSGCSESTANNEAGQVVTLVSNLTPEQIRDACKYAGQGAATGWTLLKKPSAATVGKVLFVLDEVNTAVSSYKGGLFMSCLPVVLAAIQAKMPAADASFINEANILAETILGGLDALFVLHPGWTQDAGAAAGYATAFTAAAKAVLAAYKPPAMAAPAVVPNSSTAPASK